MTPRFMAPTPLIIFCTKLKANRHAISSTRPQYSVLNIAETSLHIASFLLAVKMA